MLMQLQLQLQLCLLGHTIHHDCQCLFNSTHPCIFFQHMRANGSHDNNKNHPASDNSPRQAWWFPVQGKKSPWQPCPSQRMPWWMTWLAEARTLFQFTPFSPDTKPSNNFSMLTMMMLQPWLLPWQLHLSLRMPQWMMGLTAEIISILSSPSWC